MLAGGLNDIVVVLGPSGKETRKAIEDYDLAIVWNHGPESDMAGSLRVGLQALPMQTTSVMVLPVDHPLVSPQTIKTMLENHLEDPGRITIPVHQGRKGHPVIFPLPAVEELYSLPTLKDVVRRDSARIGLVEIDDEGVLLNLNTPADLRRSGFRFKT